MKNSIDLFLLRFISYSVCLIPFVLIFSNSIADIIVVITATYFIYKSIKNNDWLWLKEQWVKICFLIYFWLIISSFFSYNQELALSRSISWIRFIIFAASLQFLFFTQKKFEKKLIIFIFFAIIYVNIEMLIEYFTNYSLYSRFLETYFDKDPFAGGSHRISGPFKDAPKSGLYLSYFIFPTFFGLINYFYLKNKSNLFIFLFIFIILNLFLIKISGHRGSVLSIIISSFLMIFFLFFRKNIKIFIYSLIILFISCFILYNSNSFLKNRIKNSLIDKTFNEISNYSKSAYGSLSITAFKMSLSNPIFGVGLKNYRIACEKDEFLSEGHKGSGYGVSPWKGHYNIELKKYYEATCSSHPHNLYLTWLSETGIPGLLFFIIFLIIIIIKINQDKNILLKNILFLGILTSLIPKFIPMMPSLNFFSNWNAVTVWFLIGWLLSYCSKNKKINDF